MSLFSERDPCDPNPCQHGGICNAITNTNFECNCDGTRYRGATCNSRGIISVQSIPSLIRNEAAVFEISANPDTELVVTLESSTNSVFILVATVTSALALNPAIVTFSPSQTVVQVEVMGVDPGFYTISYSLSGADAESFETPDDSPVSVRDNQSGRGRRYFSAVINDPGFLRESCCDTTFGYVCPMSTQEVSLRSACEWTDGPTSNGVVFAQFKSLILPLSIGGIEIGYDNNGAIDTRLSASLSCPTCTQNQGHDVANRIGDKDLPPEYLTCYSYDFQAGDIDDFLTTTALAKTFLQRIEPLFPTWAGIVFPTRSRTIAIFNNFDYMTRLVEQNNVNSVDGCGSIVPEDLGLYSVLSYRRPLQLILNEDAITHNSEINSDPVCFAVNLCNEMQSPVFVGLPPEVQDTIKRLPVLQPYVNMGWVFSIASVTLYRTRRNVGASNLYWNGENEIMPDSFDADLRIVTSSSIPFESSRQDWVRVQLNAIGSLFYVYDNDNVSKSHINNPCYLYCLPL